VNLRDVLRPEHIVVPLRASTVKQATELLAARLVETGAVAEPNRLYAVIRNAWPEDLVSVGEHAFLPHFRTEAVRGLRTAVCTARPEQTLGEVAHLMAEHDVRALPVVDDTGSLVGVITHRELLKYLLPSYLQRTKSGEFVAPTKTQVQRGSTDPRTILVREAMARSVLCVAEDQTLGDVANLM